ncbi:hypothetical protein KF840_05080 [bacterium]|nr:hypothetical protein [bacterium]
MTLLIGWLLGSSALPAGPLVWIHGGLVTAVILTVLLLATIAVLASQHDARKPAARAA